MPLLKEQWVAGIDTIGGITLSFMIRSCFKYGSVLSIGNIESQSINLSLMPFILRGVKLIGINSQELSNFEKIELWNKLGLEYKPNFSDFIVHETSLEDLDSLIDSMIFRKHFGRTVIKIY